MFPWLHAQLSSHFISTAAAMLTEDAMDGSTVLLL